MPYALATVLPDDGFGRTACDSGDYATTFERCVAQGALERERPDLQGKLIDGRYHGLGIACFIEGGASGPREHARIEVEADGIAVGLCRLVIGRAGDRDHPGADRSRRIGGARGASACCTARHLSARGLRSYGSRSTVMGGCAIVVAANALLEKFRAVAAPRLGVAAGELAVADGVARAPMGGSSL